MARELELTDLQNFVAARTNEDLTPMHDWSPSRGPSVRHCR